MGLLSNLFSEFKIKNGVLVKYTGKDANVEIPNSVTIIGEKAFTECKTLVSVTIPNSVKSIENNAFSFCTSLKEITLPNSVTSIGDWAFFYCTGLVKRVRTFSCSWLCPMAHISFVTAASMVML